MLPEGHRSPRTSTASGSPLGIGGAAARLLPPKELQDRDRRPEALLADEGELLRPQLADEDDHQHAVADDHQGAPRPVCVSVAQPQGGAIDLEQQRLGLGQQEELCATDVLLPQDGGRLVQPLFPPAAPAVPEEVQFSSGRSCSCPRRVKSAVGNFLLNVFLLLHTVWVVFWAVGCLLALYTSHDDAVRWKFQITCSSVGMDISFVLSFLRLTVLDRYFHLRGTDDVVPVVPLSSPQKTTTSAATLNTRPSRRRRSLSLRTELLQTGSLIAALVLVFSGALLIVSAVHLSEEFKLTIILAVTGLPLLWMTLSIVGWLCFAEDSTTVVVVQSAEDEDFLFREES